MNKKLESTFTDDGKGFPEAIDGELLREEVDNDIIENITREEIQEDLKSIEEMREDTAPVKQKGLRHAVAKNALIKRKHKIKLQTEARKAQRGK